MELLLKPRRTCLVDDADFPAIKGQKWYVRSAQWNRNHYAYTVLAGRMISMHRFLLGASADQVVDHINGNGLDNRRKNLRFCTLSQNCQNSKGWVKRRANHSQQHPVYKGVWLISRYLASRSGRIWEAKICWEGKQRYIGVFRTGEEAAAAYDDYARTFHGRFARLNSPRPGETGVVQ